MKYQLKIKTENLMIFINANIKNNMKGPGKNEKLI